MRYKIQWSSDVFGETFVEASDEEDAVEKLREMMRVFPLRELPDSDCDWAHEVDIDEVEVDEDD